LTARSSDRQDDRVPTSIAPVNGIEIGYETHGDPADEPLLLVAGLGAQLIWWPQALCEALVDRGFFVVRYDNRDTGRSTLFPSVGDIQADFLRFFQGEPVEPAYTLGDVASDGIGLLDHLGIESAHVVGASMGGMIAQLMAIGHRPRVRSLTSIMSMTGEPEYGQPTAEALAVLLEPAHPTRDAVIDASVEATRVLAGPSHFDAIDAQARAAEAYDRCYHPDGVARHLLAILVAGSRADALATLDVPTVVIHGSVDPLITLSGGERTAELVPGAELIVLEGMGHDLPPAVLGPVVAAITSLASRTYA
jgi:pimeloyl-ACP methyl ester carboxylesterase